MLGLGLVGTLILLTGMVAVAITMMFALWAGLLVAGLVVLVLVPLGIRDRHGRNGLQGLTARIAWWYGRSAGQHLYRGGPLGPAGTFRLPGLAAASYVVDAEDSYGRPFGMIVVPSTGHYTAVLECAPDGAALVDPEQVDIWVAYWGQWLASLAYEPGIVQAAVTIETAPDLGIRLEREVSAQLSPTAPELARQVLTDIVDTYPTGSAQVSARIALTYSAAPRPGARRRSPEEMAREIGTRLPGLSAGLGMTGAGEARPMTHEQLAEAVRIAYDPNAQVLIEQARAHGGSGLTWADAGPVSHEEYVDHYRHDGAASITWGMSEAPRGEVYSSVLTGLLQPHRDIARKRVTLLYRPHDPATAARIVQRDRRDAVFRAAVAHASARDTVAIEAARQTEREEATGAGLVRFAMLVTATVRSPDDLPAAAAAVDVLAPPARVQLRRMYRAQASAFAAALPIGIVLPDHLRVPQVVRDAM
ncbi:membrane protein [Carbonactinospora thermoautotrophica]|uniref:Membrane protein n=1 Tax=Carbonactinospora thermoautotrophica TaxID=1469144 RepID=A0A132N7P8_9ACTN|nr:membrane protein [Carbonactinospora thermoautotrophica]KWX09972.1 membrane protein [Carbonactinospora thermoautotrophica]